jgi:hypothetical protein
MLYDNLFPNPLEAYMAGGSDYANSLFKASAATSNYIFMMESGLPANECNKFMWTVTSHDGQEGSAMKCSS